MPPPRLPPVLEGRASQRVLGVVCGLVGLGSVVPLLAWVYGLGAFAAWFWGLAAPGLAFVAITGVALRRSGRYPTLLVALVSGAVGGLAATVAYDLVRGPFVALGYQLFAPVSSYGILILGAAHSSHLTETLGWLYNFANGIGFGVAYATIGLGRRWWWAIPFALALETTTVLTPYADIYGLRNHPDVIAIAYGAHVFYGVALGLIVERAAGWSASRDTLPPVSWALVATVVLIALWQQPWVVTAEPAPIAGRPAVVVSGGRFQPAWSRIPLGGCVVLDNRDASAYRLSLPAGAAPLPGHARRSYCFASAGVKRVQLNRVPYSGGWVLVDPALGPS